MRSAFVVEAGEEVEHFDLVGEVDVGRRLVEQHRLGVLGERHRDPRALALAAGEVVDEPVSQVGQVRLLERRVDVLLVLR